MFDRFRFRDSLVPSSDDEAEAETQEDDVVHDVLACTADTGTEGEVAPDPPNFRAVTPRLVHKTFPDEASEPLPLPLLHFRVERDSAGSCGDPERATLEPERVEAPEPPVPARPELEPLAAARSETLEPPAAAWTETLEPGARVATSEPRAPPDPDRAARNRRAALARLACKRAREEEAAALDSILDERSVYVSMPLPDQPNARRKPRRGPGTKSLQVSPAPRARSAPATSSSPSVVDDLLDALGA